MSLCDGYKANHGENGLLGVTAKGHGVYYREATNSYDERVVVLDVAGTTIDEKELSHGLEEAIKYIDEHYEWEEFTSQTNEYINRTESLNHIA